MCWGWQDRKHMYSSVIGIKVHIMMRTGRSRSVTCTRLTVLIVDRLSYGPLCRNLETIWNRAWKMITKSSFIMLLMKRRRLWIQFPCPEVTKLPYFICVFFQMTFQSEYAITLCTIVLFPLECYCWKWSFKFVLPIGLNLQVEQEFNFKLNVLVLNVQSNSLRYNVYLHISYKIT